MKTLSEVKRIEIKGRRWFQKSCGNTYHSVKVLVNDEVVGYCPRAYGYGDGFLQTACELLKKAGYEFEYPLWRSVRDEAGIPFFYDVVDVSREKDLNF